MLETKGPEIRTGILKDGKDVTIEVGQTLEIFTDTAMEGNYNNISCNYKGLPQTVSIGSSICIGEINPINCVVTDVADVSY
jgi:pyruvate kinase